MEVKISCQGTAPLLMHNVRLADPLDPATQRLSALTSAKSSSKRTAEDHVAITRAEFMGGLYYTDDVGPVMPTRLVEASLKKAGGLTKDGTRLQRALIFFTIEEPLLYDGPRSLAGLWADPDFRYTMMVRVGQQRVPRTRPMFKRWGFSTVAELDTTVMELKDLHRIGETAGLYFGLGDWRPRFGRFEFRAEVA